MPPAQGLAARGLCRGATPLRSAAATTLSATAAEPEAATAIQSCYGSAQNCTAKAYPGQDTVHWPYTGYARTTVNCADINVKTDYDRRVRVCFAPKNTCNAYRLAKKGQWTVAASDVWPRKGSASDVLDGSGFYIQFTGGDNGTGQIAC
ncbi:hypothetical protein ACFVT1_13460 [Streptomyces sp. NPDC057963]|uniref:hypothetical protein n=1 Tax=Streptomyces sp. NPDC057963 TaxID=3346290 RepID=UPI0036EBD08C